MVVGKNGAVVGGQRRIHNYLPNKVSPALTNLLIYLIV
jgi:hypothetical protein